MKDILKTCKDIIGNAIPGEPDALYRKIFRFLQEKGLLKYIQKRNDSEIIFTPTKQTKNILALIKKEVKKQGKI